MSEKAILEAALTLTTAERIHLVEEVWDSLSADLETSPVSDAQRAELDARLAAHRAAPDGATSWDDVRRRVEGWKSRT